MSAAGRSRCNFRMSPLPDTPVPEAEFELELTPEPVQASAKGPTTTEEFITDLAGEVEGMEPLVAQEQSSSTRTYLGVGPRLPLPASTPEAAKPNQSRKRKPFPSRRRNSIN